MATVPSLTAKVAGNRIRATDFNAVKDYLDFLIDTPHCGVFDATGHVFTAGTAKLIQFDSETNDTDGMHSTSSNKGRVVCNTAGSFDIRLFLNMPDTGHTQYEVNLRLNSGGSSGGGSSLRTWVIDESPGDWTASLIRILGSGDYVELFVTLAPNQTSSGGGGQFGTGIQARFIGLT